MKKNDLISREEAIDALKAQFYCEGTTFDLISRQAAIEALYSIDEYNPRSVKAIRNLPSAQQERKRGRWTKDKG